MKLREKIILSICFMFILGYVEAQGCSQCKLLAEQSTEVGEASFGSNINMGILYLMAVPYILLFLLFRKRIFRFFKAMKTQ
ncbi:hypothetical protein N8328_03270 [Crocinitomicaceae bacterium]|nr:hypothetical protein [Crocinitomicaceae bacterium]